MKTIILSLAITTLFSGIYAQELTISETKKDNYHFLQFSIKNKNKLACIIVEKFDAAANKYGVIKNILSDELNKVNTSDFYLLEKAAIQTGSNSAFVVRVYTNNNKYIQYNSVEENNQLVFKAAATKELSLIDASNTDTRSANPKSIDFVWGREEIELIYAKTTSASTTVTRDENAIQVPKYPFAPKADFELAIAGIKMAAEEKRLGPVEELTLDPRMFDALAKNIEMRDNEINNEGASFLAAMQKMESQDLNTNGSGLRVLSKEEISLLSYAGEIEETNPYNEKTNSENQPILGSTSGDKK
jgi:hypothetical protein